MSNVILNAILFHLVVVLGGKDISQLINHSDELYSLYLGRLNKGWSVWDIKHVWKR